MGIGAELIELWLVTSTQMGIESELVKLRLVTSTQMGIGAELIELRIVTSTRMAIGTELIELTLVTSTQIAISAELIAKFYLAFVNLMSIKKNTKKIKHLFCVFYFSTELNGKFRILLVEFRTPDFRKKRKLFEDGTSSAGFLERRFASLLKSL